MLPVHRTFAAIWLVFTILFLSLATFHWHLSRQEAPDLDVTKRPMAAVGPIQILGADIDQPLRDFSAQFNGYVHA
jgi:hypothetical protein